MHFVLRASFDDEFHNRFFSFWYQVIKQTFRHLPMFRGAYMRKSGVPREFKCAGQKLECLKHMLFA